MLFTMIFVPRIFPRKGRKTAEWVSGMVLFVGWFDVARKKCREEGERRESGNRMEVREYKKALGNEK